MKIKTVYILDKDLWKKLNRKEQNYWDVYLGEICNQLGVCAEPAALSELQNMLQSDQVSTIMLGGVSLAKVAPSVRESLANWVKDGGCLIGFLTEGLDKLFGLEAVSKQKQVPDDYTISGYFDLKANRFTVDVHSPSCPAQKLIILSDVKFVRTSGEVIAELYDVDKKDTGFPAIVYRPYGKGHAFYFCFDAPKTVWLLHQGRPLIKDFDRCGMLRTTEMQLTGKNQQPVLYADEIVFLVQNMVACHSHPFIHQIPPRDGKVADALLFWGGDSCGSSANVILKASNWMKKKGLPYHINVLSRRGVINLTRNDAKKIKDNGHEVSLHYNFADSEECAQPYFFTREDIKRQNELFQKQIGVRPVSSVMHCLYWHGWSEPAQWMSECGGLGDNSFAGISRSLKDPDANAPFFGFGFGTSYPFFFYQDFRGRNKRIEFIEEPLTTYELGHRGSINDRKSFIPDDIHRALDLAVKYHLTLNMFYHAIYISEYPNCRKAIEETIRYIKKKSATICHMGTDSLCEWWFARSRAKVSEITVDRNGVEFSTACEYPAGMVVKVPLDSNEKISVWVDGRKNQARLKNEFGRKWVYAIVPTGNHRIKINGCAGISSRM